MKRDENTTMPGKSLVIQFPGDLRDYFAGQALTMIGSIDRPFPIGPTPNDNKWLAETAYAIADRMLAERAKEE